MDFSSHCQVKSKVAAKYGDAAYQWEIMRSLNLQDSDILQLVCL